MAKRLKPGDDVILTGKVSRVGNDEGEFTLITVRIRGVEVPVTVQERFVIADTR